MIFLAALIVWAIDAVCAEKNPDFDAKNVKNRSKMKNRENADLESLISYEASETILKQSGAKNLVHPMRIMMKRKTFDCAFDCAIAHLLRI